MFGKVRTVSAALSNRQGRPRSPGETPRYSRFSVSHLKVVTFCMPKLDLALQVRVYLIRVLRKRQQPRITVNSEVEKIGGLTG